MSTEKDQPATGHRLKQARNQGQIAVSGEVNTAVGFAAVVAYLLLQMGDIARQLHAMFLVVLRHIESVGREPAAATSDVVVEIGISLARLCMPPLLIGAVAGTVAGLAQTRGMVSLTPVHFQLQRLNPVSGVANVFSMRNLLTFVKLLVGLSVIGVVVAVMFRDMLPDMIRAGYLPAERTVTISWYFVSRLIAAGALVAVLMATADYFIQSYSFARQMRMSKQEVEDEQKNLEGNQQIKSHRKQFFQELLDEITEEKIEAAQVVVVNPTHVAVVIRYQPGKVDLPLVSVKGLDDVALAIRAYAEKIGVPVYENRTLARDLYRDCRTNEFITHKYFEAVAEIFKWLAKLKGAKQMAQKVLVGKEGSK